MADLLLIDDSPSVLAQMESLLTSAGHRVATAADGRRGIEELRRRPFDLVVTDIYMPEMDGIAVLNQILLERIPTRVIALSTNHSPVDILGVARSLGALATLHKPFSAPEFLGAVASALERPIPPGRKPPST